MLDINAILIHFFVAGQFSGFSGSSGPSQLTMPESGASWMVTATSASSCFDMTFSRSPGSIVSWSRVASELDRLEDMASMAAAFSVGDMLLPVMADFIPSEGKVKREECSLSHLMSQSLAVAPS